MLKKNIGRFVMVSLKYFFDFDPNLSNHALLIILVLTGLLKLFITRFANNIQSGLLAVKEDIFEIKSGLASYFVRLKDTPLREAFANNVRLIKENFSEIDIRGWRLK